MKGSIYEKGRKIFSLHKKIIGTALLLGAVIYTGYSCSIQSKIEKQAENLPQITNREEMAAALSGPKTLYAVLDAPVCDSPVDDVFDILADEYFYIQYTGEVIKASVYYPEDMGPQTSYIWEQSGDIRESMSAETYIYDDIPIDLTGCFVTNPDSLSSSDQVKLSENTKAFVSPETAYYYPDGIGEHPNDMEENCGLTRYKVYFMKSGTSLSFLAWIGDNEISFNDDNNAFTNIVQHGDITDLTYMMESGEVGSVILLWLFVILIIFVLIYTSAYEDEEETPPSKKKDKTKNNKKKKKHR